MAAIGSLNILTIPLELTEHALTFCHPCDVSSFSRTCRLAYCLVYNPTDQYLWRQLFLFHPFDDPRKSVQGLETPSTSSAGSVTVDWKGELLRRMKAELMAFSADERVFERKRALETFISMVQDALPVANGRRQPSHNVEWLVRVLRDSRMLDANILPNEARLHARLRSYISLSLDDGKDDKTQIRSKERRVESRCYVYDLRHYCSDSNWGPYIYDGRVNWVHVEALVNVILMNLRELPSMWVNTRPPVGLEATRPYSAPGDYHPHDWAGVEGTWRRYVCFMDYRDLYAFNYSSSANSPCDASFFDNPSFREATRLIELELHLIPAESMHIHASHAVSFATNTNPNYPYPPLFFSGTSRRVHGNEAVVEGQVRMGWDGVVRWQFTSIYGGHIQWSSEGVQVGNIASAIGVVGVWTTALHDQGDPVGPFWLWKVKEDHPTHPMEYM